MLAIDLNYTFGSRARYCYNFHLFTYSQNGPIFSAIRFMIYRMRKNEKVGTISHFIHSFT